MAYFDQNHEFYNAHPTRTPDFLAEHQNTIGRPDLLVSGRTSIHDPGSRRKHRSRPFLRLVFNSWLSDAVTGASWCSTNEKVSCVKVSRAKVSGENGSGRELCPICCSKEAQLQPQLSSRVQPPAYDQHRLTADRQHLPAEFPCWEAYFANTEKLAVTILLGLSDGKNFFRFATSIAESSILAPSPNPLVNPPTTGGSSETSCPKSVAKGMHKIIHCTGDGSLTYFLVGFRGSPSATAGSERVSARSHRQRQLQSPDKVPGDLSHSCTRIIFSLFYFEFLAPCVFG